MRRNLEVECVFMNTPDMLERKYQQTVKACGTCGAKERKGGGPLLKCSRCRVAKFCGPECIRQAWKRHKAECNIFRDVGGPEGALEGAGGEDATGA